jgi:hypothetical protein
VPLSAIAAALCAALLAQGEVNPGGSEFTQPEPVEAPVPRAPGSGPEARAPSSMQLHEGMLSLGGWGAQRYGINATGGVIRLARGSELVSGALQDKLVDIALELALGETGPGLRLGEAVTSVMLWSSPRRAVRGGIGLDVGAVSYRRVTTGGWEVGGAAGARVGLHVDLFGTRDRVGFFEMHGAIRALSQGAELSAFALVGLAFRTEDLVVRTRADGVLPEPGWPVEPAKRIEPPPELQEPGSSAP